MSDNKKEEFCVVIRFDAIDEKEALTAFELMRECFATNPDWVEVDSLIERTSKNLVKVLRRNGYSYATEEPKETSRPDHDTRDREGKEGI